MKRSKRAFDLIWSILGITLLAPAMALIAVAVKLGDGGPVFFRHERVGLGGRRFLMWKFRTMVPDAPKRGAAITIGEDPRITTVGRWLRRLKLDELPQLLNVVAGQMSLVGPRPEVPKYVELYTPEQRAVLDLVPGITDVASIAYRNESEILARADDPERTYVHDVLPDKIRLNLDYAARATTWTDFLVILKTLRILGPGPALGMDKR